MSEIGRTCERCRRNATREEGGMFDYCIHCSKNLCDTCFEVGLCQDDRNKNLPHRASEAQVEPEAPSP